MTQPSKSSLLIRNLRDGPWYWAPKAIIREKAKSVGFLALAVYHFLASMVDTRQMCFPSQMLIAKNLSCSRTSVTGAIKKLEACGLIRVLREKRARNIYELLRVSSDPDRHTTSATEPIMVNPNDTNDIRLSRIGTYERNVVIEDNPPLSKESSSSGRTEVLASDLATALNEPNELPLYISLANRYPESFLRETLSTVNQTPRHKIKKSRGALFTYLVKRYGHRSA